MQLKNESYDLGKWSVCIFLPSLAVLIGGLGELYGSGNGPLLVATINLLTMFLGSILQISSESYQQDKDSWGGGPDDPSAS